MKYQLKSYFTAKSYTIMSACSYIHKNIGMLAFENKQ